MKKVLVVDDSATMRRMIIASLNAIGGVSFDQAVSGLEAIERMTLAPADLVMLDLNMPDVHGLEVLRFIRGTESLRAVPVVVLTTRADEDTQADLSRIFEPFIQVGSAHNRPHGGTGLGLAVSRGLARALGGDLTVTSEVGAGSVFTAVFPV